MIGDFAHILCTLCSRGTPPNPSTKSLYQIASYCFVGLLLRVALFRFVSLYIASYRLVLCGDPVMWGSCNRLVSLRVALYRLVSLCIALYPFVLLRIALYRFVSLRIALHRFVSLHIAS